jgi:hypothetical protein
MIRPRRVSIDVLKNTFTAQFDPLPEADYTLRLVSGETAFEDAVGNPLDGEPEGGAADGTPTGDGTPGGDYVVDFIVDRDDARIDGFQRERPFGGLVYSSHDTGRLSPVGDQDTFLVSLDAGQLFSAVATPRNPAARLTLTLPGRDPITAAAPGAEVFLPSAAAAGGVTLAVTLSSDVPTEFDLHVFVNTVVERPSVDSTPGAPMALAASRIEIASGLGHRLAVLGASSPQTQESFLLRQDFEQGLGGFTIDNAFGQGGGLWRLSSGRQTDGDPNHSPPRSLYFGQNESPLAGGDYQTGDVTEGAAFSPPLDLPAAAEISLSFHHFLETEGIAEFDVAEVAVVSSTGPTVVLSSAGGSLPTHTGGTWQRVSADLSPFNGQRVRLRFGFNSVDDSANFFEGWFVDDVQVVASIVTAPEVDEFTLDVSGASGAILDVVLAGVGQADFSDAMLQIVSADGSQVLAAASSAPLGGQSRSYDLAVTGYVLPAVESLRIRVTSGVIGDYVLVATESLALESEPNDFDLGPAGLRRLNDTTGAIGFLEAGGVPFQLVREFDPSAFIDIATTGRPLGLADDGMRAVNLRVGNEFFPAGPILVSNNGAVLAGANGVVPHSNSHLPFAGFGTALVPFWDDIGEFGGDVFVGSQTIDGLEALIVQWDDRPHFSSFGTGTFQVQILAGGPRPIRYAYRDVDFGQADVNSGASATIGFQQDAIRAAEFSFNSSSVRAGDVISVVRLDPSDNFRLDLNKGDLATLSIERPLDSSAPLGDSDLVVRLEVYNPAGAIIASARGAPSDRRAVVSFVAAAKGSYTIRVVPEEGSGEYVLALNNQPIPGDFDADGDVDGNDLKSLLLHFGIDAGAMHDEGDADEDGDVDRVDLGIWRQNVGLGAIQLTPPSEARSAATPDSSDAAFAQRPPMWSRRSPDWALRRDAAFAEYGMSSSYGLARSS